jgi:NAD+ kinase
MKGKIGLAIRPGVQEALLLARELINWSKLKQLEVLLDQDSAELLGPTLLDQNIATKFQGVTAQYLAANCDPIVTLGGDGTLLKVARFVQDSSPVLLGVNFGRLGFLTEVAPNELLATLELLLSGQALIEERPMLMCKVFRAGHELYRAQAVNDGVIHKAALDRLPDLDVLVDREFLMHLRADGLIVATPTGSTAYSLAAGGSIVHPALSAMLVTPISPHSLTSRPLILSQSSVLEVVIPSYEGKIFLSVDGQDGLRLEKQDRIEFSRANVSVRFVRSSKKTYFQILREKLNWGIPNRAMC